jgi:putative ABC transport system permease protein
MRELSRGIVRAAARLVPGSRRREFRAEWDAELATDPSVVRAIGAVADAWFLFRQPWSPDMILQDIRYSLRVLARRPAYTVLVLVTLAVGIGAAIAVFSAIDTVLLRPLPYPDAGRLVTVWENDRLNLKPRYPVAPANWDDWRTGSRSFENLAAYLESGGSLAIGTDPVRVAVPVVSTAFFDVMGVRPLLGRTFTRADATPPAHRALILSFAAWQRHFGSDPGVIDRSVDFTGVPFRIIGVMPPDFRFPIKDPDGWRPMAETPSLMQTRAQHFFHVVGRLKPGTSVAEASRELEEIAVRAQKQYPETNDQRGTTMLPLQEALAGELRTPMLLLGAAVAILLVIGAVNVANLMLVEATARRREMALRAALGADRLRIVRQLLVEGLILAAGGGALGVGLAWLAVGALGPAAADYVPGIDRMALDGRVLAFAVIVSAMTGIVFTLAPAVAASGPDVQQELRDGARGSVGGTRRLRGAFVMVEFAAAVVLVIGAGLVVRSFWNVIRVQPGFASDHVMVATVDLPRSYQDGPKINQFYTDVVARLTARAGIRAAGAVNNLPVTGNAWTAWLTIENAPLRPGEPPEVGYRTATPGYFAALGIPMLDGRGIADADTADSLKVAVVNRALADRFFPSGGTIGSRIRIGPNPKAPWRTIVGIAGNVHHAGPEADVVPEVFLPNAQDVNGDLYLAVRGDGDSAALAGALRDAVRSVDASVTLYEIRTMEGVVDEHLAPRRLSMLLVQGFALVALALALIGIYGVLSYTVSQRAPEIGVRMALGASPSGILRMTIRDGLRLAVPGIAIGVVAALAATRLVRAVLFDVSPTDPASYAVLTIAVTGVALAACYLPARRASRVDPLTAIRDH